jgi:single-strand DNA-binding protein
MENDVRVTINGWVSSEPQARSSKNGEFLTFRLGSTPRYRRDGGEYADLPTEWFDVKVRTPALVRNVAQSVSKGQPVIVSGRLSTNTWQGKDGTQYWGMQIQADVVGHDLRWGESSFTKVPLTGRKRLTVLDTRSDEEVLNAGAAGLGNLSEMAGHFDALLSAEPPLEGDGERRAA